MKHFSPTEWVDFVRNVVVAEQRVPMQEHLDQGCGKCLKMVKTWATMVEFARHELFYEPPADAVRNAESYFFSFRPDTEGKADVRILRHVFDSFYLGDTQRNTGLWALRRASSCTTLIACSLICAWNRSRALTG